MYMMHLFYLILQSPVFNFLCLLLAPPAVHFNIHLPDLISKPGHHLIIILALFFQARISPIHITDSVIELCNSVLHVAQLISQATIVTLNVSEPLHLHLDIVKLARSTIVILLRSIGLQELLSQHLDLIFSSIGPLLLHLGSVI